MRERLFGVINAELPARLEPGPALDLAGAFVGKLEDRDNLISHAEAMKTIFHISDVMDLEQYPSPEAGAPWPRFIQKHGFYTVITQEFIQELLKEMSMRRLDSLPAIEICAGRGVLSRQLRQAGMDIVAIDNGSDPRTRNKSLAPVTDTLDNKQALEKYKPSLVVGGWLPNNPEVGQDILNFPSVNYFLDVAEAKGGNSWLTGDYENKDFKIIYLHNVSKYAIGTSDYFSTDGKAVKFNPHTEVRLWKRKGAPMSLDHQFDQR